jgi:hypothetical protein
MTMRSRTNRAPTMRTIILAAILILVGVLGTFSTVVPNQIAVIAYIAAGVLLLIGIFVRGL